LNYFLRETTIAAPASAAIARPTPAAAPDSALAVLSDVLDVEVDVVVEDFVVLLFVVLLLLELLPEEEVSAELLVSLLVEEVSPVLLSELSAL
jgi:hypothetical protein